jgi:hypothetical protein
MSNKLLDLGIQPLVNNLLYTKEESINAKKYPMAATIDDNLKIQLDTAIPSEELYEKYLYHSAVNKPYVYHCQSMWHSIKHLKHNTVIDVGGNDGTLLKAFRSQTKDPLNLINVDASSSFREENLEAGIEYVNDYFNEDLDLPKADIITSTNVFQHTPGVEKFLAGVKKHLAPHGVWVLEFPYTLRTFETLQFDQFYHEHYYYWLVTPLVKLFDEYGLRIVNTEEQTIHGGTLRLWISHKEYSNPTGAPDEYLKAEKKFDFFLASEKIHKKIVKDKSWIKKLNGKVAFFGAAAKGCVYLNALDITLKDFPNSYIVDDTVSKQNMFVPGTGFEVVGRERLYAEQPENLIILAHNFKDFIIKSLRPHYTGKIITMLPSVQIDLGENY